MSRFRNVFPHRHVILPVVHVVNEKQALRNTKIAREAGADGVFLINHDVSWKSLLEIQRIVAFYHTDWWIGVDCLDLWNVDLFAQIDDTVAGVWVDNALRYLSAFAQNPSDGG